MAEILADTNSYGFRPKRSTHDAIQQCFTLLAQGSSPQWILEGDIKACFDKISHEWLENNIMMDKNVLKQWLKSGFMDKDVLHDTVEVCPQGSLASPTLANITLDGMETSVMSVAKDGDKVHFVRYADDFICTANSKEILENKVQPAIINFLKERGLELSQEKTKITHINEGFDFLGFNVRKYKEKLRGSCKTPFGTQFALLASDSLSSQVAYFQSSMSTCEESEPMPKSSNWVYKASFATPSISFNFKATISLALNP